MFFNILKKDLKRKKTMNLILLLFIILASMFLASSVNSLVAVNGAVEHFMKISKVPDFFAIAIQGREENVIDDYLHNNSYLSEYAYLDAYTIAVSIDCYIEEYCQIIRVHNTGFPAAVEELPHLFDSFYRGSNVEGKAGNGLGLYISREIMHKMDGELFAERAKTECSSVWCSRYVKEWKRRVTVQLC